MMPRDLIPWAMDMVRDELQAGHEFIINSEFGISKSVIDPVSHRPRFTPPIMASGTNPHLLRLQVHNTSGRSSPHDSHPGTPRREDDEHAPLLRHGDIDRAAHNGATRSHLITLYASLIVPLSR